MRVKKNDSGETTGRNPDGGGFAKICSLSRKRFMIPELLEFPSGE